MRIEKLHGQNHNERMRQAEKINRFFPYAIKWHALILKQCGVPEEDVKKTTEELAKTNTRNAKIDFINQTANLVGTAFKLPVGGMNADLFLGFSRLAFDDEVTLDDLPGGISRVDIATYLIRAASEHPEDLGHVLLAKFATVAGNGYIRPMGMGVIFPIDSQNP